MTELAVNALHDGDNLGVMRSWIPDEVADLIYLDPPFNSSRSDNLLFKQVKDEPSSRPRVSFEGILTRSATRTVAKEPACPPVGDQKGE